MSLCLLPRAGVGGGGGRRGGGGGGPPPPHDNFFLINKKLLLPGNYRPFRPSIFDIVPATRSPGQHRQQHRQQQQDQQDFRTHVCPPVDQDPLLQLRRHRDVPVQLERLSHPGYSVPFLVFFFFFLREIGYAFSASSFQKRKEKEKFLFPLLLLLLSPLSLQEAVSAQASSSPFLLPLCLPGGASKEEAVREVQGRRSRRRPHFEPTIVHRRRRKRRR